MFKHYVRHHTLMHHMLILVLASMLFIPIVVSGVQAATLDHVVINEYEQNPAGSNKNKQWAEIYNPTTSSVNLSLWEIETEYYHKKFIFPMGTIINPNEYLVIDFSGTFLKYKDEQLTLLDLDSNEKDKTPITSDLDDDGKTWQRYPNGEDTGSDTDWEMRSPTKWLTNGGETVTCSVSSSSIQFGEQVTVSGSIEPGYQTFVKVEYREGGGSWNELTIAQSNSNGDYSTTYSPKIINTYEFRASTPWDGGAVSSTASVTVNKLPSQIYILSLREIELGDNVSVIGYISPLKSGETVQIKVGLPNGTELDRSSVTVTEGYFNYTFQPDLEGVWNFTASWSGDETYNEATSSVKYLTVKGVERVDFFPLIVLIAVPVVAGLAIAMGVGLKKRPSYPPPPRTSLPALMAGPAAKTVSTKKSTPPKCLFCKSPTVYVPDRRKYYCSRCKMYL